MAYHNKEMEPISGSKLIWWGLKRAGPQVRFRLLVFIGMNIKLFSTLLSMHFVIFICQILPRGSNGDFVARLWCPIICSNTRLDVAVKIFMDVINFYYQLTSNKAHYRHFALYFAWLYCVSQVFHFYKLKIYRTFR